MSKNNFSDIVLDIETLSLRPNALVLSVSAIGFNPMEITTNFSNNSTLDILLNLDDQPNRDINDDTVSWWSRQNPIIQKKVFGEEGRISVVEAIDQITKFCWLKDRIWIQGPTFDVPVLNNLFEEYGKGLPWAYHTIRDSRTLLDLIPIESESATHDSLADCIRQAIMIQKALSGLGVKQFARAK